MEMKGKNFMDNPKGMYSYKDNPLKPAKRVEPMCGPGGNPDQQKANKMLKMAMNKNESLRGKAGM
jgi:hypothetical protein